MLESMWMKSNWGERESASAIARCGASKIEMSCTPPTPMPVCFLNSAITGCIGTKYGDQIMPLTSAAPAALAAVTVRSSIEAASASGVVPGMRFAIVRPTPPSMNPRREIFDLLMTSSLQGFLFETIKNANSDWHLSNELCLTRLRTGRMPDQRAECKRTLLRPCLPATGAACIPLP